MRPAHRHRRSHGARALVAPAVLGAAIAACRPVPATKGSVTPVYRATDGRLTELRHDVDGDGRPETVSHMDGNRVVRVEVDGDRDGLIDRWEYYDEAQRLERVGFSRARNGRPDAWSPVQADGTRRTIRVATSADAPPNRTERYEGDELVAVEEDTDGDGRVDKWETHRTGRLVAVTFDSVRSGQPDTRLIYDDAGAVRVERLGRTAVEEAPHSNGSR